MSISELADVKCSGNWMWAAKLPGEGAKMFDACKAMCKMMSELNIAIDGGKDSLSMAARVKGETVKSPGKNSFKLINFILKEFFLKELW